METMLSTTALLHGLLYLLLALVLLGLGRAAYGWMHKGIHLADELVKRDNPAFALQQIGYWSGLLLIIGGVMAGPSHGLEQDLLDIGFWALLGIVLLNLSMYLNDKFVLYHFDNRKEILQDQNAGTGAVEGGSALASGLLIHGALSGEGSLLTGIAAWTLGQIVLILAGLLYTRFAGYDVHGEIEERDNVPAGVAFAGMLIATGNLLRFGTSGDFDSWYVLLQDFFIYGVLSLLLMVPIRMAADHLLLPGEKLSDEIATQEKPNLAAGLVEAFAFIAVSVLISWSF